MCQMTMLIRKKLLLYYSHIEMIISIVIVISQLFTNSLSISRTKSIITYCSPLSITVDLHTSLIGIITSLKTYHTIEKITVPDSSGICTKMIYVRKILILTAVHSSIISVSVSTFTINDSRERTLKDSEVVVTSTV